MEMKVDIQRIKTERARRAWSQEHLAEAAGLGLRTVHRIEKSGRASLESVKALAAVFELMIEEITLDSSEECHNFPAQSACWAISLYAWLVAAYFGASMLDSLYAYNLAGFSASPAVNNLVFSQIADSLLFILFLVFLTGLAALVMTWQLRKARYLLLLNMAIGLGIPLLLAVFVDVTTETSAWGAWLRISLGLITVFLAFSAQWHVASKKPEGTMSTI